ncbi:MAG: hypothetical protein ACK51A_06665, partial [Sphingobacteriia bacterium]
MPKQAAHQRGNRQAMRWVLGISILLSVVKFTAWSLTGSDAILSDALESLINVAAGSFALYSILHFMVALRLKHLNISILFQKFDIDNIFKYLILFLSLAFKTIISVGYLAYISLYL